MKKINVALIGYGHLGKWHAQKIVAHSDRVELYAIVDRSEEALKTAAKLYPETKMVIELGSIIDEIDAAIVVTSTSVHYQIVKQLLEKGKHVFCEKPLCSLSSEAQQLDELARKAQVVLQVGHSERCHEVWERLDFKKLNTSFTLDIKRVAPFKGRAVDVDVVQDLMIHDLDLVIYLTGQIPQKIKAYGHKMRTDKWDHVEATLEFKEGSMAKITASRNYGFEQRSFELTTKEASHYVDLFQQKYFFAPSSEVSSGEYVEEADYQKRDHLLVEHSKFYQSILHGEEVFVSAKQGVQAIKMVEAVLDSLASQDWVNFSE